LIPKVISTSAVPTGDCGFHYKVYGMLVRSNLPIEGLTTASSPFERVDLNIRLGFLPTADSSNGERKLRYESAYLDEAGEPDLRIWVVSNGEFLHMTYSDGVEFWLDRDLKTLWARWPESVSLQNTLSYLVGPIFGLLLRLRGLVCLHGSAVAIKEYCVVLVGTEGAGKSTTAACFAGLGFAALSDDIVALVEQEGKFQVVPAYPRVNLWPESVEMLYGSRDVLPLIATDWSKRFLALGQEGAPPFGDRPLPLGAIYIFGDPAAKSDECVEQISQKTALMRLVQNTYATNFLDGKQRAEEFSVLSRLVSAVPIRAIHPRRDVLHIKEFCGAIQRDFETLITQDGETRQEGDL
jgi:hypothetical protein